MMGLGFNLAEKITSHYFSTCQEAKPRIWKALTQYDQLQSFLQSNKIILNQISGELQYFKDIH